MPTVLTNSTQSVATKTIQFTLDEVIEALAEKAGFVAPDFGAGEGDSAAVKRYSVDANGDADNLWSTDNRGDGIVVILEMTDEEVS